MVDLDAIGIRSYISKPDRGRRNWEEHPEARGPRNGEFRPTSAKTRMGAPATMPVLFASAIRGVGDWQQRSVASGNVTRH